MARRGLVRGTGVGQDDRSGPLRGLQAPVLVCEDDPMSLQYFRDVLEGLGCRVITASDGRTALREALRVRPAVILLDLAMPELDGVAVLTRLRRRPATMDIPVIVVSAYPGWMTFLDRREVDAVIEKPCLPEELESAVLEALEGRLARLASADPAARPWHSVGQPGAEQAAPV